MPSVIRAVDSTEQTLSEDYIQECFHSYLKSSLMHAKVEGLLDENALASAEADLMITGPALCLYFAALRSTTSPPSVPLPRRAKNGSNLPPTDLSLTNCPPAFRQFLIVWSQLVPTIQALSPEHQHDLARVICGLDPQATPLNRRLNGIAADLRAVAIEISMRRTFQEKYASDLQVALDSGAPRSPGGRTLKASFVPPPSYDDRPSGPPPSSPHRSSSSRLTVPSSPPASASTLSVPSSPARVVRGSRSPSPSISSIASSARTPSPSPSPHSEVFSPTILADDVPGIEFIRETLYAALADVLERRPALRRQLRADPARAYFAAVALAILDVASSSATLPPDAPEHVKKLREGLPPSPGARAANEPVIRGVLGQSLALSECPEALRPFMVELCAIGSRLHEMEEEDSDATVRALQRGEDPPVPRLERVYEILERGVGHARRGSDVGRAGEGEGELRRRRTSTEGRAVAFANRINALALGMTKLRAFRERQEMVFKVLGGAAGS